MPKQKSFRDDSGDGFEPALRERVRANLARFERRSLPLAERRAAAVCLTLVPLAEPAGRAGDPGGQQACFVLTRRAPRLGSHAGQWAIPGGHIDPGETAEQAALRELREEVGLDLPAERVLGRLDDYATRSGYVITPIVAWGPARPDLVANPNEVAAIYRIPIADLDHPDVPQLSFIPESDRPVLAIPFERLGTHINAPTAAILFQLREVAIHGRDTRVAHYEQPLFAWR